MVGPSPCASKNDPEHIGFFGFSRGGYAGLVLDSLSTIKVPVQLWASEHGPEGVSSESVAALDRRLPANHEYHVVPNAGHFAFLIPCPPALAKAEPEICTDAPGFDRVAFHKQLNADVLGFFRTHLTEAPRP